MSSKSFISFCLSILAVIVFASVVTAIYVLENYEENPETKTLTITLTILHTWENGGQYYFADELGSVYLIGCCDEKREIGYADMPKIRFDKLEEGHRYNVEYVLRQGNVKLSVGEKEMVR